MEKAILPDHWSQKKIWLHENIALGHISRKTEISLPQDQLPYTEGEYTIVCSSRIDNRELLCGKLGVPKSLQTDIPDALIVLKAYQKWGNDCPPEIEGEWAFGIWDNNKKELFLARDLLGNTGIFYFHQPGSAFVFSSSVKALLALDEIPKIPNDAFIAGRLANHLSQFQDTAYSGIYALESGYSLTLKDRELIKRKHTTLRASTITGMSKPEDYIESFLEHYQRAVDLRIKDQDRVGVTLSGGLDSGSVSALAATSLKDRGQRLSAYTSIPLFDTSLMTTDGRFGDERPYADATADFHSNIDMNYIDGKDVSILDGIYRHLEIHDSPGYAVPNFFWIIAILEKARSHGIQTLLTGQGGNGSVSWTGSPIRMSIPTIWDRVMRKEISKTSALINLLKYAMPDFMIHLYRGRPATAHLPILIPAKSPINADFADRIDLRGLYHTGYFHKIPKKFNTPIDKRLAIISPENQRPGNAWQESAFAFDMEILDPTRDRKLTEFCLGIPDTLYHDGKYDRLVIRQAMKNLLPDKVRLNQKRGRQAADSPYRLQQLHKEMESLLEAFQRSEIVSKRIDLTIMKSSLKVITHHVDNVDIDLHCSILLRGITTGLFLLRFENKI
ncbi:Asparagine synthase [Pedobacter sp. BAL39]|uniref:asparagine synthase-related protein n=1 Tax=Pedobacter sp. BAL39 TaxID=391596 RepID=UPI00015596FF|nr:asparagine synthase-related protein [Pedobacter sp. BAL39]EDM37167.1 Asparagine synthase [Pedobacter sp. BAL39]